MRRDVAAGAGQRAEVPEGDRAAERVRYQGEQHRIRWRATFEPITNMIKANLFRGLASSGSRDGKDSACGFIPYRR